MLLLPTAAAPALAALPFNAVAAAAEDDDVGGVEEDGGDEIE